MPELGKATYELIFDTRQGEAAVAGMEARADAAAASISESMGVAERSVNTLGATMVTAGGQVSAASGEMAASMKEAGAAGETMGTEVAAGAGEAATATEAAAAKTVIATKKSSTAWTGFGKKVKSVAHSMTEFITAPALIAGGVGAKMFIDFSASLKLLQTQAGATSGEVAQFKKGIMGMAEAGQVTEGPNELAKAMFRVQSDIKKVGGVTATTADKLSILETAAHGAQVGMADLDSTTYALVSALNTGLKDTKDFGQTMGIVNSIVGAGDLHLQDLTAALSTGILPAAKSAGLGLKDVGAAIAVFTSRGQPAQISATRLGMAIAQMQAPTKKAQGLLKSIGIGSLDLARIMRSPQGLLGAIQYLVDHLNKVKDPAKRAQIVLGAFGGGRMGKAMLTLVQNVDDLRERMHLVTVGQTKFQQALDASNEEPIVRLRKAWVRLQAELIKLGAVTVPIFVKIADAVASVGQWFDKLSPRTKKFALTLIGLLATVGPLLTLVLKLRTAFLLLTGPVGIIMALAAAFLYAYQNSKKFRDSVNSIAGVLIRHRQLVLAIGLTAGVWLTAIRLANTLKASYVALRTALFGVAAAEATVGEGAVAAEGRVVSLRLALMGLGSTVVLAGLAAAVYGVLKLKGAWDSASDAMDAANKAEQSTFSGNTAEALRTYALTRVKALEHGDSKKVATRKALRAARQLQPDFTLQGSRKAEQQHAFEAKVDYYKNHYGYSEEKAAKRADADMRRELKKLGQGVLYENEYKAQKAPKELTAKQILKQMQGAGGDEGGTGKLTATKKEDLEFRIAQARAQRTKTPADDIRVLQARERQLRGRLSKTTGLAKRADIEEELTQVAEEISSLRSGGQNGLSGGTKALVSPAMSIALSRAQRTKRKSDDIGVLRAEKMILEKRLAGTKALAERAKIEKEITTIDKSLAVLRKQEIKDKKDLHDASVKEMQAYTDARGTFFSEFAPNVFGRDGSGKLTVSDRSKTGRPMEVHQHNTYHEIPRDRYKHERQLRKALQGAVE